MNALKWVLDKIIFGGAAAIGGLLAAINRSDDGTHAQ